MQIKNREKLKKSVFRRKNGICAGAKRVKIREKEVVPEVGVEPTRCYQRQILSLVRLPFRHSGTEGI